MIVLDASLLIAHLNSRDAHHDSATSLLLAATEDRLLVHTVTLAEVLVGAVRIGRAISMRDELLAMGVTVAAYDEEEPLRLAELRASSGLKLPDCCVLDVAIRRRAALATFDGRLADAARQREIPVVP